MSRTRIFVLFAGSPLLVAVAYAICFPDRGRDLAANSAIDLTVEAPYAADLQVRREALEQACRETARRLAARLPNPTETVIHPPFVLAGDLSHEELETIYEQTVYPTARALWREFFDHWPDQPVAIVVASDNAGYASFTDALDGYDASEYSGYTQRRGRRIVCNLATGRGTLVHELTHVMVYFDFPDLPEWFDEGLASLFESTDWSSDGRRLVGLHNRRSQQIAESLVRDNLPHISTIIRGTTFRGEGEGLNYALARSFCLCLQEQSLLTTYYRKLRESNVDDSTGAAVLCELLDSPSLDDVDQKFRNWLKINLRAGR